MPEVEKNQTGKVPPIGDTVHDIEMLKDNEVPEDDTRRIEGTFAHPEFHRQVPNDSEHHHQDGEPANNTYGVTNIDNINLKRHPINNKSMDSLLQPPVRSSKRRRKAKVVRSSDDDNLPQEEEEQNAGKNRQDNSGSGEGSNVLNSTLAACTEGGGHAGGRHHHNNNNRSTTASMSVSALSADEIATSPQLDRNAKDEINRHAVGRKKLEDGARSDGNNGDGKAEQGAGREKRGKSNTVTNAGSDESRDGQKLKNQRSITPAAPPSLSIPCAAAAPGQVSNNNRKSIPAEQSHVDFISAAKAAQQLSNLHQNFSAIQAQFVGQIQTVIKTAIGGGPSPPDLDVGALLRACSKAHEIIQSVAYKPAAGLEVNVHAAAAVAAAAPPPLQPKPNPTSLLMPSLPLPPSITTVPPALQKQPLSLAPPAAAAGGGGIFPPLPPTQQFPYGYAPGSNASMLGGRDGGDGTGTGLPLPLQHYQQQQQTQSQQAPAQQQQIHRNLQQQQPQQPHLLNQNINMSLVGGRNNNNNIRIRRGNAPTFTGFMPTPHEEPPPLFTGGGERTKHVKGGS
jgi:hypothetical protein